MEDMQGKTATGRYWKETKEQQPSDDALDRALAARLWQLSAAACGLAREEEGA